MVHLGTFYAAMFGGALVIEFVFRAAGSIPQQRTAQIVEAGVSPNYTTILNKPKGMEHEVPLWISMIAPPILAVPRISAHIVKPDGLRPNYLFVYESPRSVRSELGEQIT